MLFSLFAVLVAPAALAQEETGPLDYYQVELVFFRHMDQSVTTPEIPRMPEPELTDQLEQDLARLATENDSIEALSDVAQDSGVDGPRWFPVNKQHLLLTDTVERINRIDAYELLSYVSWGQEAPDVTVAQSLNLTALGIDAELLNGTTELHQRRYLHLALDIALTDRGAATSSARLFDSKSPGPAIKDSRRIRLEKLQYFDQPDFGVLAIVSRIDAEREELRALPPSSSGQ